jgi:hypothetical protein
LLALVFLWFWPRGVIPERRRRFAREEPEPEPVPARETVPDSPYVIGGG